MTGNATRTQAPLQTLAPGFSTRPRRNMPVMTVALDRLAISFANGVFERGDCLLLRRGGAGHVENFFLQGLFRGDRRHRSSTRSAQRQSEADPIRLQVVDLVEVNTAHRKIAQLLKCGGALDIGKDAVGLRRLEPKGTNPVNPPVSSCSCRSWRK